MKAKGIAYGQRYLNAEVGMRKVEKRAQSSKLKTEAGRQRTELKPPTSDLQR